MKRLLSVLTLGLFLILTIAMAPRVQAEEEIIDLYPYDQIACLEGTTECTNTMVGSSHWTLEFNGYRYHFVSGSTRMASLYKDNDGDGKLDATEIAGISYSAFAQLFINDTDQEVVLKTSNGRVDLTANVVHRIYAYFDADGKLGMVEDHIFEYLLVNKATEGEPADWHLANEAEQAEYEAADEDAKPANMAMHHVRMKVDATEEKGYKLEPLTNIKWQKFGVNIETQPIGEWSDIIEGDPNNVYIPAGWKAVSFGQWDRATYEKPIAFVQSLPYALVEGTKSMTYEYEHQPPTISGLAALDKDAATPGVQYIIDHNKPFDFDATIVSATWHKMYNDDGTFFNDTEKLDYKLEILQNEEVLETINFAIGEDGKYTASAAQTQIDTSVFGNKYQLKFSTINPKEQTTEREIELMVGVMPPKIVGAKDLYIDEYEVVDLMEGITADNSYGQDLTEDLVLVEPKGFSRFYPQAGKHEMILQLEYDFVIPAVLDKITFAGETWEKDFVKNQKIAAPKPVIGYWDISDELHKNSFGYASGVIIEVVNGKVVQTMDRLNWNWVNETNPDPTSPGNCSDVFDNWVKTHVIGEDSYVLHIGHSSGLALKARTLKYQDDIEIAFGTPEFRHTFNIEKKFFVNVADNTAPEIIVINGNYKVSANDFEKVNDAILANVVATDNFNKREDISIYVSDNGGLKLNIPGTYTVEVTAEDEAGNEAVASFQVVVVQAEPTAEEQQAYADQKAQEAKDYADEREAAARAYADEKEAAAKAYADQKEAAAKAYADQRAAEVQAGVPKAGTSLLVVIVIALVAAGAAVGVSFLLFKKN